jgi:hypothetical protein
VQQKIKKWWYNKTMKRFGKLVVGPGGIFCSCCNARIGNFSKKQRHQTKKLTARYLRRKRDILPFELD